MNEKKNIARERVILKILSCPPCPYLEGPVPFLISDKSSRKYKIVLITSVQELLIILETSEQF